MDMKQCGCVPGTICAELPNRYRKIVQPGRWWPQNDGDKIYRLKGEGSEPEFSRDEALVAQERACEAARAEFGEQHSVILCQSMQHKIMKQA